MTSPVPRIANSTQAALLLNRRYADILAVLALGDAAATQVAQQVGKPLSSVHAQLESLLCAEVIRVGAVRTRAGRPIREYQLPLPWHIPFAATTAPSLRDLLSEQLKVNVDLQVDALATALEGLYESPHWFIEVKASKGVVQLSVENTHLGRIPSQPMTGSSLMLRLTPERALDLKMRLDSLISEFQESQPPEDQASDWGLMVLLTPPSST